MEHLFAEGGLVGDNIARMAKITRILNAIFDGPVKWVSVSLMNNYVTVRAKNGELRNENLKELLVLFNYTEQADELNL